MSVSSTPRIVNLKASGAIKAKTFVIFGATKDLVSQSGANGKVIGIYQGEDDAVADDFVEIALPGGGALLQVSEVVALGKFLTSDASGLGEVADAAGERVGAVAYEPGAAANDIIGVEVVLFDAHASDA